MTKQIEKLTIESLPAQLFQRYWSDADADVRNPEKDVWEVRTRREKKRFERQLVKGRMAWVMTSI